ncbi:hypothetical protein AB0G87_16615 [Streptomyces asoensis]|uniref:hypothetical protein n=1 Tax=Streptomyces asoensis TaxID=249586 RepID=UPI0033FDBAEA
MGASKAMAGGLAGRSTMASRPRRSEAGPYDVVRRLADGVAPDRAFDVTDPDSWIDLDLRVRELASQEPELMHSHASLSGRRMHWPADATPPTVTWDREPDDAELALALCHRDGRIREAALDRTQDRPVLLALVVIRCADWAEPVRTRARAMLSEAPRHQLAAHAPLILRVGHRTRGALAERLLVGALRTGTAAQLAALLDSGDRATARLAHRVAVERRLLPAARLARIAARHHDTVVQDVCADGALAALGEGASGRFTEVVPLLLGSRRPRVRSAGVTALRRAGRYGDAEPYLTDRSAVVRACARYVVRQGGTDPAPLYRALCADPTARPTAAVGLGECGVRDDADALRALLAHPAPRVRACAVAGLRALDAVRVDDVRPLLADPSAAVVRQVTAALLPSADQVPPSLLRELLAGDRPRHQRIAATRLLRSAAGTSGIV